MFANLLYQLRGLLVHKKAKLAAAVCLAFLLHPAIAASQQSDDSGVEPQLVRRLLDQISQLEANQRQLTDRIAKLEKAQPPSPVSNQSAAADQSSPSSAPAIGPNANAPSLTNASSKANQSAASQNQQAEADEPEQRDVSKTLLNIRGFGDFGLYGGNQKGQTTSFSLGETNLFITSNLSEKFRFLTELVFEVHQNNAFETDLERILLEYSLNDYFKLSAGRYHTAIGYYNTAFHQAAWFQTATERPYIFEYEHEGGILPIHTVGVEASGQIPSGKLGLHYVAEVGNGRSSDPTVEAVQNYVDENNRKAVDLQIFARPDAIAGLQTGFSIYRDILATPSLPRINEEIMDAYAVLSRPRFEWLNEALLIRHAPQSQRAFNTPAFYTQISERFGQYRPYFRYQYVNASSLEPVFTQVGLRTGPSVGIRFDPTGSVALKLQYDHTELRRQPLIDGKSCPQLSMCSPDAIAMQVDFKF